MTDYRRNTDEPFYVDIDMHLSLLVITVAFLQKVRQTPVHVVEVRGHAIEGSVLVILQCLILV